MAKKWLRRQTHSKIVLAAVALALLGAAAIQAGLAVTFTAGSESEAGAIAGQAGTTDNGGASGNRAVRFGSRSGSLYDAVCAKSASVSNAGIMSGSQFSELSGITASRTTDNTYWVHNDSGDSARIFSVDGSGKLLGTFSVSGAQATDWEDIASGPGPDKGQSYIYIADTGNNDLDRKTVQVYRLPEPAPNNNGGTTSASGVQTLNLNFDDGAAHNVEAVFIDPATAEIYLIDKSDTRAAGIYKSPPDPAAGSTTTVTKVGILSYKNGKDYEKVTAADISPSGDAIAVRTYDNLYIYERPSGTSVAAALVGTGCKVSGLSEPKGEAVGFTRAGNGLVTTSEGNSQPLYRITPK